MSSGMLGRLPLSATRGPRDTLEQCLASESGEQWLKAFNKFLRGENPWPIVSKVVDRGYKISVGDGKTVADLVQSPRSPFLDENASRVIYYPQFKMDNDKEDYDIVILEFGEINTAEIYFRPEHVWAEMRRLKLDPPGYEDALRFMSQYSVDFEYYSKSEIYFLHKPVRIVPEVGPGGLAIGTGEDGKIPAVLTLANSFIYGAMVTARNSLHLALTSRRFAARRFRPQDHL